MAAPVVAIMCLFGPPPYMHSSAISVAFSPRSLTLRTLVATYFHLVSDHDGAKWKQYHWLNHSIELLTQHQGFRLA